MLQNSIRMNLLKKAMRTNPVLSKYHSWAYFKSETPCLIERAC